MIFFEVEILYPVTSSLLDDEELSETEKLSNHLVDDFMIGVGYWDLTQDPIARIEPKCIIPKGKTNKKHFSEVVFVSGNVTYCNLKPEELKRKLDDFKEV